ncbi:MAG TPA: choice-of-anchor L domain-containing protein [Gemmataceae bacterium]|nr:choice-of-anchor L domain-containing protein [Gemmataceae bacterium]
MVAPDITYDANSLTLQFTTNPGVNSIQFQFVFGSEEFPVWVGQYNDIFAAFLDGKQISYDPAGNAISVNNNFFQLDNSANTLYPTVTAGKTVVAYDIQYNGLTPALTTTAALDPTITTHTLKFVIADTRDQVLDSGVFLTSLTGSGGSGGGTTEAPQANAGGPYTVEAGKTVQLSAANTTDPNQPPSTLTYKWDLNGNGIYGETGAAATNGNEVGINPTFVAAGLTPGTNVTVSLQVTDSNGLTSTDQSVIHVIAPVLSVNPVTPPVAVEGQSTGTQTLTTFVDAGANLSALSAVVNWGDGKSVTLTGANGGIVQNADGSFSVMASHTYAEEASGLSLSVQVTDANGTTASASAALNVSDPAVVAKGGFTLAATQGTALTGVTVASFVDPGGAEPNATDPTGIHYTADINWGDGGTSTGIITFDTMTNTFKVLGDHTYAAAGNFVVTITIHHESAPDAVATSTAAVAPASSVYIGQGPGGPHTLMVIGTAGDDVIRVVPHGENAVRVIINGVPQGDFAKSSFSAIAIYGLAGNDILSVNESITSPAFLFGGSGNDTLRGGGGPSILVGGSGADKLTAGDGATLFIAGSTDFDTPHANDLLLSNLLKDWTDPTKKYADRAAAVEALLAGHVFNDNQQDIVSGGDEADLYFISLGDVLRDRTKGEIVVMI